jgi:AraC-like DNA-binding protein
MNIARHSTGNSMILEAPGDLLSELLGVIDASLLLLEREDVCSLPSASGQWYVLSPEHGSVNLAWGDRAWTLSAPQAAVFPGNEELSLLAGEESAVRFLNLIGTAADRVFSACRKEGGLFFENGGIAVEHVFSLLSSGAASASEASEAAYGLLMALYGTQSAGPEEGKRLPLVVEAALGIIRRDFAFLDGIGELAERLEVSQEYLTRSFCRYIGITPGKYLTRVRIENARLLLRQGGHSVQFVSEACGFTNANYFARVFRAAVGMNPAEYARHQPSESDVPRDEHLYVL